MKILKLLINLIPNRKIRHDLVNKYFPKNTGLVQFIVDKNTKCLMVCPHPDDEINLAGQMIVNLRKKNTKVMSY